MQILPSLSLLVLCVGVKIQCADILVIAPSFNDNHKHVYNPLWLELASRGHHLTVLTHGYIKNHENITQIDFFSEYQYFFEKSRDISGGQTKYPYQYVNDLNILVMPDLINAQFKNLVYEKIMDQKFDLLLLDLILPSWPYLSHICDCPMIGLTTTDATAVVHDYMGNPIHPAIYPWQEFLGVREKLGVLGRVQSTWYTLMNYFFTHFTTKHNENKLLKKYFGSDWSYSFDFLKNASLVFINANPIFHPPRPLSPKTINLNGFLSIRDPKRISKDLQTYLDNAKHGCIYVSFGTTVNSEYLSKEQKDTIVQVFADMAPMKILWKFDDINVAKDVKNVEVRNWVPQQDVLRHPNIKLFITQGGLQSMEEAIDSGVPMLGMPFYGDQFNNVLKMDAKKFGLKLHIKDMTRETLKSSLDELLKNPIYKKNIDKYSAISKDQPMKGLDKAVWWTEYVLRHGGTEHLRSPSADIPLYQYYFLDVIAVSIIVIWLFVKIMKYVFRFIHKLIFKYITYPLLYKPKTKKE